MLVVLGMTLALLGAGTARRTARLHHGALDPRIGRGLARDDAARRDAHVSAVEAQTNAAGHLHDGLGQVGIRTYRAGGRALGAGLDAARDCVEISRGSWMRLRSC